MRQLWLCAHPVAVLVCLRMLQQMTYKSHLHRQLCRKLLQNNSQTGPISQPIGSEEMPRQFNKRSLRSWTTKDQTSGTCEVGRQRTRCALARCGMASLRQAGAAVVTMHAHESLPGRGVGCKLKEHWARHSATLCVGLHNIHERCSKGRCDLSRMVYPQREQLSQGW